MAGPNLVPELRGRIDGGIDVATQTPLRRGQGVRHRGEGDVAHHEDIDVAVAAQLIACRRAEDEGHEDAVRQGHQGLPDDVDDSGRLQQERIQLGEDGALAIRLEIDVSSLYGAPENSSLDEQLQLALYGSLGGARLPHDLPKIEPLVGMTEEPGQDQPARTAKEDRGRVSGATLRDRPRTHIAYDRTPFEYDRTEASAIALSAAVRLSSGGKPASVGSLSSSLCRRETLDRWSRFSGRRGRDAQPLRDHELIVLEDVEPAAQLTGLPPAPEGKGAGEGEDKPERPPRVVARVVDGSPDALGRAGGLADDLPTAGADDAGRVFSLLDAPGKLVDRALQLGSLLAEFVGGGP